MIIFWASFAWSVAFADCNSPFWCRLPQATAEAAKNRTATSCPFEYAAQLTEVMLLGVVALRAGKKIEYDGESGKVTNIASANEFLQREPKPGWSQV